MLCVFVCMLTYLTETAWLPGDSRVSEHVVSLIVWSPQIFDEEYAVLHLDQGGALVAIRHTPLPIRHLL